MFPSSDQDTLIRRKNFIEHLLQLLSSYGTSDYIFAKVRGDGN